jgi:hypothetical protein
MPRDLRADDGLHDRGRSRWACGTPAARSRWHPRPQPRKSPGSAATLGPHGRMQHRAGPGVDGPGRARPSRLPAARPTCAPSRSIPLGLRDSCCAIPMAFASSTQIPPPLPRCSSGRRTTARSASVRTRE